MLLKNSIKSSFLVSFFKKQTISNRCPQKFKRQCAYELIRSLTIQTKNQR